jgi:hypothetical protein
MGVRRSASHKERSDLSLKCYCRRESYKEIRGLSYCEVLCEILPYQSCN